MAPATSMATSGDLVVASKPTSCLGSIVRMICGSEEAAVEEAEREDRRNSVRAENLGLAAPDRKALVERRGGLQTTTDEVLKGMKAKFESMERLEDADCSKGAPAVGTEDIDFIRMLQPSQFKMFFKLHGIDPAEYGKGHAKTVKDLWAEVVFRECELQQVKKADGQLSLQRFVRVVMVEVEAKCANGEVKHLILKDEAKTGLSRRNLYSRMSKKMFDDETVEKAMWRCIIQNMAFEEDMCKMHFKVLSSTKTKEYKMSSGFPGLPTSYDMFVVRMQITNPKDPLMKKFGLPNGTDFKTTTLSLMGPPSMRTWTWCSRTAYDACIQATAGAGVSESGVAVLSV